MISLFPSPPRCWGYWGGCDPSPAIEALRAVASAFGFGPGEVFGFLVVGVLVPVLMVLFVDPLPSDWRTVAVRAVVAVAIVAIVGHGSNLFASIRRTHHDLLFFGLVGMVVAGFGVFLTITALRSWRLVGNLRGGRA